RREFIQSVALAAAVSVEAEAQSSAESPIAEFTLNNVSWKVYEDLSTRDGAIRFVPAHGSARSLAKSVEAAFAEADPPYLGLALSEIGTSGRDLLADRLLEHGDPDPEQVRLAAPPLGSARPNPQGGFSSGNQGRWNAIVGTKECSDTMPVFPG